MFFIHLIMFWKVVVVNFISNSQYKDTKILN